MLNGSVESSSSNKMIDAGQDEILFAISIATEDLRLGFKNN